MPKKTRRAARGALLRGAKVTAGVRVRVADSAGNARTLRRSIRLTLGSRGRA